ncbi:Erf4 domain-containing protein [Mycena chlorophos]|uniref:Ras modification protein ERF4 n=1 Tax=Mycena chlorophos TaxID=658473 RepID=A0A8H6T5P2_MYCCL|nr:Erf4 domain-containing protein [Mycena chlorophos]
MSAEQTLTKEAEDTTLVHAHHEDAVGGDGVERDLGDRADGDETRSGLVDEAKGDKEQHRQSTTWPNGLPPSPPLTSRYSSADDADADYSMTVDGGAHQSRTNDHQHNTNDLELDSDDEFEAELKPRAAAGVVRKASRIDLDAKMEPQPWDLVDPPPSNNGGPAHAPTTNGEYYASLSSKKYNTLSSARGKTLIPKSSYYFGPPPPGSAYGTPPVGQIGLHHPREILRVERDYTGGELIQFAPIYPLELEGRVTPTQFLESINEINEVLISAHSLRRSFLDNMLAVFTLQLSRIILTSHYDKEMRRLEALIRDLNVEVYNPAGLNILWPRRVAFLFVRFLPISSSAFAANRRCLPLQMEIEYY